MTKGRAAMWVNFRAAFATGLVLGLLGGCGQTKTTESGETHFMVCETDGDCAGASDVPSCSGGFCRDENGNKLPASTSSNDGPRACAGGCGDSECAAPAAEGQSGCALAAACKVVDCDSVNVDENACVRPGCESDADCPLAERCTSIYMGRHYDCSQNGSSCDCTAGHGLFHMHLCSPVAKAGDRGTWEQLVVSDTVIGMETRHVFTPDGHVEATFPSNEQPSPVPPSTLSPDDVDAMERLVNGPLLRMALVTTKECPLTKSRDVIVQLYLQNTGSPSIAPIEMNVAGCLGGESEVPAFTQLMDIVNRY
jgi:hypothetical protein